MDPAQVATIDERLDSIGRQRFRAKFHLLPGGRDRSIAMVRGPAAMRAHAHDIIVICRWIERELLG